MAESLALLRQHPVVLQVATFLDGLGVQGWLVGGVVRDALLGRPLHDIDLAVDGDGIAIARQVADHLRGAFVLLDGERGVGRVVLQAGGGPLVVDVAALRSSEGIEADLRLRDFTVNAMALTFGEGPLIDPTGGLADLEARQIVAVSAGALADDPLRMLRGVRLAGQLGFALSAETEALVRHHADLLPRSASERVRDELLGILAPAGAAERVRWLDGVGLLAHIIPELLQGHGVTQSPPHTFDVFEHNLAVLDAIETVLAPFHGGRPPEPPTPELWDAEGRLSRWREAMAAHLVVEESHAQPRWLLLKLAALLHDVGKPATRSVGGDGRIHFYKHEMVGAEMVEGIAKRLRFASRVKDRLRRMILAHLRPLHLSQTLPPSRKALFRYFQSLGHAGPDVALLSIADQRGKLFAEDRSTVMAVVQAILAGYFEEHEALVTVTPIMDGNQIMAAFELRPGPRIGQLVEKLREAQAAGHVYDPESAKHYLRQIVINWRD